MVDDNPIQLGLWDVSGRGNFDQSRLRPLSYPQTDVFLICCSISNKQSFDHVKTLWAPEIKEHICIVQVFHGFLLVRNPI